MVTLEVTLFCSLDGGLTLIFAAVSGVFANMDFFLPAVSGFLTFFLPAVSGFFDFFLHDGYLDFDKFLSV